MSAPELDQLLVKSRQKNRSLDVTGVLLYCNGSIIQVLEGDEHTVKDLYQVISQDARHHHVTKLFSGKVAQRSFSDWQMGYRTLNEQDMSALVDQVPSINNPYLKSEQDNLILTLVQTFYKNNHRN